VAILIACDLLRCQVKKELQCSRAIPVELISEN
jgi:hypothetical protein